MSDRGAFITGADFLIDGGATASYFYGPLKVLGVTACKIREKNAGNAA